MSENLLTKTTKPTADSIIHINTMAQLNKLSLTQIMQLNLANAKGSIIDLAKMEALRIEIEKQPTPIKQINISINLKVDFKQKVVLLANVHSWSMENAINLYWSDSHFWRCNIPGDSFGGDIEYKYAISDEKGIIKWEEGSNRAFSRQRIERELENPLYCLMVAKKRKIHLRCDGREMVYEPATYTLSFLDVWQLN